MRNVIFDPVFVKRKQWSFRGARESAQNSDCRTRSAHSMPLGNGSCLAQNGHPFAVSGSREPSLKIEYVFAASPETIRREPRELISFAQSANCRTWQPARCVILSLFLPRTVVRPPRPCDLLPARSSAGPDPQRADTRPSSGLRPALLDWHCLSAFRFHRPVPVHGSLWAPTSRLRRVLAGYVCCAVWKAESVSPCRRSSFRHRKARNN